MPAERPGKLPFTDDPIACLEAESAARPRILVSAGGKGLVSPAGAALLVQPMRVTGLERGLREALGQWLLQGDD